jgi:hypothetical protein
MAEAALLVGRSKKTVKGGGHSVCSAVPLR